MALLEGNFPENKRRSSVTGLCEDIHWCLDNPCDTVWLCKGCAVYPLATVASREPNGATEEGVWVEIDKWRWHSNQLDNDNTADDSTGRNESNDGSISMMERRKLDSEAVCWRRKVGGRGRIGRRNVNTEMKMCSQCLFLSACSK